jgi:hypothetical protein
MNSLRRTRAVIVAALIGLALGAAGVGPAHAAPDGAANRSSTGGRAMVDFDADGLADLVVGVPNENVDGIDNAGGVNVIYGTTSGLNVSASFFISQDTPGITGNPEPDDYFGTAVATADFNGDGYTDLAIGVPGEDYITTDDGFVHILYGGPGGLTGTGSDYMSQDEPGIAGTADFGDGFGQSLAAGEFGNGSIADLAVGVPLEDVNGDTDAGAVNVIYGTSSGLSFVGSHLLHQDTAIYGDAEPHDKFGFALVAANFGKTAQDDLVVSSPYEDYAAGEDGGVHVIYGGGFGLNAVTSYFWSQDYADIEGTAQESDLFGYSVAAGDFDDDSYADLAVGVPYEDEISGMADAGAVNVLYGSSNGLTASGDEMWSQNSLSISGLPEIGDHFGYSLAAKDFGNGSYADLAIGVPQQDVGGSSSAGAVNVIYGSSAGLNSTGNFLWTQDSIDSAGIIVAGLAEYEDNLGYSLAAANFGNSTHADLAIGVPFERTTADGDGGVNVLYGSSTGLTAAGNQFWSQESVGIYSDPEEDENFGKSLAAS